VVTIGQSATARAYAETIGANGSCTCTTSKRSRANAREIRVIDRGVSTMFDSEPFAGTITDRPTGMTYSGGRS
jgi:hypothetical protein